MLQQTTVSTVRTRFEEFIKKWPTLKDLAKTTEPNILKFWSGLGYYSRARNLLKAAKIINIKFDSRIPKKYDELISLPGIGDYTAKAIMGIGYNESVMPLDANIERIFARLYALNQPLVKIKKQLQEKSNYFISKDITTSRLGNSSVNKIDAKVIIVDSVGRLSQLYWDAQIAYIGGGFSSGIHNVMEPAIARLPVFFGPEYSSFHEAEELILKGGGFSIESGAELYIQVKSLCCSGEKTKEKCHRKTAGHQRK